ncbi:rhombotarget lipoprotein [Vibrio sp. HN007]|uniref:rhombotarget lipoprotein n=1 Tax=Vibrio iocasae TaxID=3098914 RepID=UPI0035D4B4E6
MKKIVFVLALFVTLFGCAGISQNEVTVSSSLVDFLYPDSENYKEHQPSIPHLTLPINVGIAFVPSADNNKLALSAKRKHEILTKVKDEFLSLEYVNRIEVISDAYLKQGGSFDNLKQLSRLYDVQVMALVSYDQVARNTQNNAALLYWTIAGMYLIPGDENNTQTFVDTAVFDINSQKLLFRAPGISDVESYSTAVGVEDNFYDNSNKGFNLAVSDMVTNLKSELEIFKVRVKEEKVAKVSYSDDYSGGGIGWPLMILVCLVAAIRLKTNKPSK